ncbi:MAG: bifunctional 4-hydroxy-2-oxoglutarate aldolase/2-dehydro-3-deoxy-phosphogluconate aldolase [Alphaproteobacteria bacterium]
MTKILEFLEPISCLPIITGDNVKFSLQLCEALLRCNITAVEWTLRTPGALSCVEAIATRLPEMVVGVGTIRTVGEAQDVQNSGAKFGVSPGATDDLITTFSNSKFPWLPGASTASEMMSLWDKGFRIQKFFPAEASGGIDFLKSVSGPLPDIKFCPTGGITAENTEAWLALPQVICVGGSWLGSFQSKNYPTAAALDDYIKLRMPAIRQ